MGSLTVTLLLLLWTVCFLLGAGCGWFLRGELAKGETPVFPSGPGKRKPTKPLSDAERRQQIEAQNIENFGTDRPQMEVK